ncbi:hypothetical protein BGX34_003577 [Mortierella sp. NVP85]|nr:hypothetical protein BGX34_003577 [Mortierella sp. NVP85]
MLGNPTSYAFEANIPATTVSAGMSIDDSLGFDHLKSAMAGCGFRPRQIQHVWRLLAAILHLGNLQFTDPTSASKRSTLQDTAIARNPDILDFIANILGVPSVVLNAQGSSAHRDSLARALYMDPFGYLVEQINRSLCHSDLANFVALLDQPGLSESSGSSPIHMAGFEQFSVNSATELLYGFMGSRM